MGTCTVAYNLIFFVIEDKAVRVKNYVKNLEHEFYELLSATGVRDHKELSLKNIYVPVGNPLHARLE